LPGNIAPAVDPEVIEKTQVCFHHLIPPVVRGCALWQDSAVSVSVSNLQGMQVGVRQLELEADRFSFEERVDQVVPRSGEIDRKSRVSRRPSLASLK
jgi:non-ribosomal peptide synthetase component E (peptide arylation enzyme)